MIENIISDERSAPLSTKASLPIHWQSVSLESIAEKMKAGGTPKTDNPDYWRGNIPLAKVEDITQGGMYLSSTMFSITEEGVKNSNAWVVPENSILLSMYGTAGEVVITQRKIAVTQNVLGIIPRSEVDVVYLYFALKWAKNNVLKRLTDKTIFHYFSLEKAKQIVLPFPPLSEQQAIAHILQTIQNAIQTRRKELDLERERKAALMQHLFTHGTRNEPTKQSEVGEIPESWEIVPFDSICQFLQYGTSEICNDDIDGIPVLRIPNVINGYIDTQELKFIKLPEKTIDSLLLETGDLLFVRTNGNRAYAGRCAVFNGELEKALFASYLIRVRLMPETILSKFAQLYTMIDKGRKYLSGKASNAADGKFNINTQTIKQIKIAFPNLNEQKHIVEAIEACDSKITALEKEIALHEELFRVLLEELMTGRLSTRALIE
jgi:type I restriction enzyme S subunit